MCPSDAGDAEQALSYPAAENCYPHVQCEPQGHVVICASDKNPLWIDWLVETGQLKQF